MANITSETSINSETSASPAVNVNMFNKNRSTYSLFVFCTYRDIYCGPGSGRWSAESCRRPDRGSHRRTGGTCRHLLHTQSRYMSQTAGHDIEGHSGSLRRPRSSGQPGRGTRRPASGTGPQPLTSAAAAPRPAASCLRVQSISPGLQFATLACRYLKPSAGRSRHSRIITPQLGCLTIRLIVCNCKKTALARRRVVHYPDFCWLSIYRFTNYFAQTGTFCQCRWKVSTYQRHLNQKNIVRDLLFPEPKCLISAVLHVIYTSNHALLEVLPLIMPYFISLIIPPSRTSCSATTLLLAFRRSAAFHPPIERPSLTLGRAVWQVWRRCSLSMKKRHGYHSPGIARVQNRRKPQIHLRRIWVCFVEWRVLK